MTISTIRLRTGALLLTVLTLLSLFPACGQETQEKTLSIRGAVENRLSFSMEDLQAMPGFHINYVASLEEKQSLSDGETLVEIANFEGVLLRDLLEKAGMEHKKKYEPAVFFRVKGEAGQEVVFSFGEIMYSSIGRSTLLAFRKDGKPTRSLQLVVSNDIRNGRRLSNVSEVSVERLDIEMKVYAEKKEGIVRPPTTNFEILDKKSGNSFTVAMADLAELPEITVDEKVQIGDCEGFHGIYSYRGATLRSLLENKGVAALPYDYSRYVGITSENGFSATYSMGELFNSKLGNNIIIAFEKDGKPLEEDEAFAMMVAVEDSTGGRSVKHISNIYIY
jgi:DMSO/TMAO reductase YedYZ molybdopterin-dependent catalytic subunit